MQPFQIYATGKHLKWDRPESSTVVKSMVIKLYGHTVHIERQDDSSFEVKVSLTANGIYLFHMII